MVPRVLLEEIVTANQYKAVLGDHIYLVMKNVYFQRSGLLHDDIAPSKEHKGSLDGLMVMEIC